MIKRISVSLKRRRRKRRLEHFRQKFVRCGYPLDDLDDSKIEAALTAGGAYPIEDVPLSAKTIYFALRRLPQISGRDFQPPMTRRTAQEQSA